MFPDSTLLNAPEALANPDSPANEEIPETKPNALPRPLPPSALLAKLPPKPLMELIAEFVLACVRAELKADPACDPVAELNALVTDLTVLTALATPDIFLNNEAIKLYLKFHEDKSLVANKFLFLLQNQK